jgi:hypothetical protein
MREMGGRSVSKPQAVPTAVAPMPPQDTEAEEALLGSMMLCGDIIADVLAIVPTTNVRWFLEPGRQAIFEALVVLHEARKPVDCISTRDALEASGRLQECGGVEYVGHCAQSMPNAANFQYYAKRVRDMGIRRDLIAAAHSATIEAHDLTEPIAQTVDRATKRVRVIAERIENTEFRPHLATRRMADVQGESLAWLWPGRFPSGKVSLLVGQPDGGKTFVTMDMAARVSTGTPWPDCQLEANPVGNVLVLNGEDDPSDTLRVRLDGAGADVSRIHIVDGFQATRDEFPDLFRLDTDLGALDAKLSELQPRLCIIDPVSCFMGRADSHKDSDLRKLIAPLAVLAGRHRCCILLVSHLNKRTDSNAMNRVQGSIALPAAARACWLLQRDPADDGKRLILPVKCNLGEPAQGIAFRILDGRVCWLADAITETAAEVLSANAADGREQSEVERWLRDMLADGPVASKEIDAAAKAEMIRYGTLQNAKKRLRIKPRKSGMAGGWEWSLPEDAPEDARRCTYVKNSAPSDNTINLRRCAGESERLRIGGCEPKMDTETDGHLRSAFDEPGANADALANAGADLPGWAQA